MIVTQFYKSEVMHALVTSFDQYCLENGKGDPIATNIIKIQCAVTSIIHGANAITALTGTREADHELLVRIEKFIMELIQDERNLPMPGPDR